MKYEFGCDVIYGNWSRLLACVFNASEIAGNVQKVQHFWLKNKIPVVIGGWKMCPVSFGAVPSTKVTLHNPADDISFIEWMYCIFLGFIAMMSHCRRHLSLGPIYHLRWQFSQYIVLRFPWNSFLSWALALAVFTVDSSLSAPDSVSSPHSRTLLMPYLFSSLSHSSIHKQLPG